MKKTSVSLDEIIFYFKLTSELMPHLKIKINRCNQDCLSAFCKSRTMYVTNLYFVGKNLHIGFMSERTTSQENPRLRCIFYQEEDEAEFYLS